jgi:hypothetical protein
MDVLQEARHLFDAGEMHKALEVAQVAAERKPKDAEAWWLLAVVSRHVGLEGASDRAFERAAALSKTHPMPVRVSRGRIEKMVADAVAELSRDSRQRLAGPKVRVASLPARDQVAGGVAPDALVTQAGGELILFQTNLENRAADERELERLVRRTLQRA